MRPILLLFSLSLLQTFIIVINGTPECDHRLEFNSFCSHFNNDDWSRQPPGPVKPISLISNTYHPDRDCTQFTWELNIRACHLRNFNEILGAQLTSFGIGIDCLANDPANPVKDLSKSIDSCTPSTCIPFEESTTSCSVFHGHGIEWSSPLLNDTLDMETAVFGVCLPGNLDVQYVPYFAHFDDSIYIDQVEGPSCPSECWSHAECARILASRSTETRNPQCHAPDTEVPLCVETCESTCGPCKGGIDSLTIYSPLPYQKEVVVIGQCQSNSDDRFATPIYSGSLPVDGIFTFSTPGSTLGCGALWFYSKDTRGELTLEATLSTACKIGTEPGLHFALEDSEQIDRDWVLLAGGSVQGGFFCDHLHDPSYTIYETCTRSCVVEPIENCLPSTCDSSLPAGVDPVCDDGNPCTEDLCLSFDDPCCGGQVSRCSNLPKESCESECVLDKDCDHLVKGRDPCTHFVCGQIDAPCCDGAVRVCLEEPDAPFESCPASTCLDDSDCGECSECVIDPIIGANDECCIVRKCMNIKDGLCPVHDCDSDSDCDDGNDCTIDTCEPADLPSLPPPHTECCGTAEEASGIKQCRHTAPECPVTECSVIRQAWDCHDNNPCTRDICVVDEEATAEDECCPVVGKCSAEPTECSISECEEDSECAHFNSACGVGRCISVDSSTCPDCDDYKKCFAFAAPCETVPECFSNSDCDDFDDCTEDTCTFTRDVCGCPIFECQHEAQTPRLHFNPAISDFVQTFSVGDHNAAEYWTSGRAPRHGLRLDSLRTVEDERTGKTIDLDYTFSMDHPSSSVIATYSINSQNDLSTIALHGQLCGGANMGSHGYAPGTEVCCQLAIHWELGNISEDESEVHFAGRNEDCTSASSHNCGILECGREVGSFRLGDRSDGEKSFHLGRDIRGSMDDQGRWAGLGQLLLYRRTGPRTWEGPVFDGTHELLVTIRPECCSPDAECPAAQCADDSTCIDAYNGNKCATCAMDWNACCGSTQICEADFACPADSCEDDHDCVNRVHNPFPVDCSEPVCVEKETHNGCCTRRVCELERRECSIDECENFECPQDLTQCSLDADCRVSPDDRCHEAVCETVETTCCGTVSRCSKVPVADCPTELTCSADSDCIPESEDEIDACMDYECEWIYEECCGWTSRCIEEPSWCPTNVCEGDSDCDDGDPCTYDQCETFMEDDCCGERKRCIIRHECPPQECLHASECDDGDSCTEDICIVEESECCGSVGWCQSKATMCEAEEFQDECVEDADCYTPECGVERCVTVEHDCCGEQKVCETKPPVCEASECTSDEHCESDNPCLVPWCHITEDTCCGALGSCRLRPDRCPFWPGESECSGDTDCLLTLSEQGLIGSDFCGSVECSIETDFCCGNKGTCIIHEEECVESECSYDADCGPLHDLCHIHTCERTTIPAQAGQADCCPTEVGICKTEAIQCPEDTCTSNDDCFDSNPCTVDRCLLEFEGACCGGVRQCVHDSVCGEEAEGSCDPRERDECIDDDPCTVDSCVLVDDTMCCGKEYECVHEPIECSDNDECQVGDDSACDDGDACTIDSCELMSADVDDPIHCCGPATTFCSHIRPPCTPSACTTNEDCDDEDPFTIDYCEEIAAASDCCPRVRACRHAQAVCPVSQCSTFTDCLDMDLTEKDIDPECVKFECVEKRDDTRSSSDKICNWNECVATEMPKNCAGACDGSPEPTDCAGTPCGDWSLDDCGKCLAPESLDRDQCRPPKKVCPSQTVFELNPDHISAQNFILSDKDAFSPGLRLDNSFTSSPPLIQWSANDGAARLYLTVGGVGHQGNIRLHGYLFNQIHGYCDFNMVYKNAVADSSSTKLITAAQGIGEIDCPTSASKYAPKVNLISDSPISLDWSEGVVKVNGELRFRGQSGVDFVADQGSRSFSFIVECKEEEGVVVDSKDNRGDNLLSMAMSAPFVAASAGFVLCLAGGCFAIGRSGRKGDRDTTNAKKLEDERDEEPADVGEEDIDESEGRKLRSPTSPISPSISADGDSPREIPLSPLMSPVSADGLDYFSGNEEGKEVKKQKQEA